MKDNIITIILVILIILVIIGTCGFAYYMIKNAQKDDVSKSQKTSYNESSTKKNTNLDNTNKEDSDDNIEDEDVDNNISTNNNEPDGTAMKLGTPKTKKAEMSTNDGKVEVDKILIDDCVLVTSDKLNKNGYEMNLTNDNKILNISSNDGLYNCKIARFSSVNPFELTEEQEDELYDELDNNEDSIDFYSDNNINRFTSFSGFTDEEMKNNVWDFLDINTDELDCNSINEGFYKDSLYTTSNSSIHLYELSNEELPFAGLFVKVVTCDENEYESDEVDLWVF